MNTRLARILAASLAVAVLALVFAAYMDPHLRTDVANRLWSCF